MSKVERITYQTRTAKTPESRRPDYFSAQADPAKHSTSAPDPTAQRYCRTGSPHSPATGTAGHPA